MSEDGQPDEAKEWEDYEGIEQNMYPQEEDDSYMYHEWQKFEDALESGVSCLCGKKLTTELEPEMYEHDGGIYVPHNSKKQWVYVTCKKCGYQNSFKKLALRMKNRNGL